MKAILEKLSITGKVMSVGFMGLMLIVASWMISSTVSARRESWNQIRKGLVAAWGEPQDIIGPILRVPVTVERKNGSGQTVYEPSAAWFLPEKLAVDGAFGTELLRHGICKTSVYSTDMRIEGAFPANIAAVLAERGMEPDWDQAKLILGVSDLRGIKSQPVLDWGGSKLAFQPTTESVEMKGGVLEARLGREPRGEVPFSATLKIRGSRQIAFVPIGRTTTVALRSPWKTPEFIGPFFPDSRSVDAAGFRAAWNVLDISRSIPQYWFGEARDLKASRFGVDFAVPVGTETALLERSRVEHIMLDKESYGGWGGRVLVQSLESLQYFIYGHLRHDIPLLVGEIYAAGTVLGTVGETQVNGGWAPHLHLQRMDETFIRHYAQHLEAIDGYMHRGNPLLEHVLDPMPLVKFLKE